MIHNQKNYSKGRLNDLVVNNGDTFYQCNFTQKQPHTAICSGYTGLTFDNCNLFNCDVPAGSVVTGNFPRHKSCCYWLHPTWGLEVEDENCSHVVETDTITIDGVLVDTIYHRKDTEVV